MESGINYYADPVPLKEERTLRSTEVQPLLTPPVPPTRVMADDESADDESADQESQQTDVISTRHAPAVQRSSDNGPTYAQTMMPKSLNNTVSLPAATEKLVYDDVQGFKNSEVRVYIYIH